MKVSSFRTRAAICAAGAAVVGALTVAVAPTAHAAPDQWGGIWAGPAGSGQYQIRYNDPDYDSAAYFGNYTRCPGNGKLCRRVLLFNDCGALASNNTAWSAASGANQGDAEAAATADLPGSWIVASACNNGGPIGSNSWQG